MGRADGTGQTGRADKAGRMAGLVPHGTPARTRTGMPGTAPACTWGMRRSGHEALRAGGSRRARGEGGRGWKVCAEARREQPRKEGAKGRPEQRARTGGARAEGADAGAAQSSTGRPVPEAAVRRPRTGDGEGSATECAAGAPQVHVAAHHTGVRRKHGAHPGGSRNRLSMDTNWCLIGRDGVRRRSQPRPPWTQGAAGCVAASSGCSHRGPLAVSTRTAPGGGQCPSVSSARSGSVRLR